MAHMTSLCALPGGWNRPSIILGNSRRPLPSGMALAQPERFGGLVVSILMVGSRDPYNLG